MPNSIKPNGKKCKRCGECCRIKLKIGEAQIWLDTYCPALDVKTKLCTVFSSRHATAELAGGKCATIPEAVRLGVLPDSCACTAGTGYKAPPYITEAEARRRGMGYLIDGWVAKIAADWSCGKK